MSVAPTSDSRDPRHLKKRPAPITARRSFALAGSAVAVTGAGALNAAPAIAAPAPAVAPTPTATPMAAPKAATAVVWLRYGATGSLVKTMQQRLGTVTPDGSFGPRTLAAVKNFQAKKHLYVDGEVGPATWTALGGFPSSTAPTPAPPAPPTCSVTTLRYGAVGIAVRSLQTDLGTVAVDGSFGPATLRAVKAFQASKRLPVTGVVDRATWAALGDACGTAAPKPPATSKPPVPPVATPAPPVSGHPGAAYRLPWAGGTSYRITQGPSGAYSHNSFYNRNAVDIAMPVGTPVEAARGGVVQDTGYTSMGGGNYVLIKDASGLCQVYFHLSTYSVVPGQQVAQGAVVARSGNTGDSSGAHLHFDLLNCSSWGSAAVMDTVERGTSYSAGLVATSQNR